MVSAWSYPQLWSARFTTNNWLGLFRADNPLLHSLLLSLSVSVTIAVTATVFGFTVSKQLLFSEKYQKWVRLAFYPYLIAPVVLGSMLQFYFVRLGLTGTLGGVLLAQALFILPYSVLLIATFWSDRVRQLAFQASSLGASSWQVNRTVLLPLARPWLVLCLVQCFLISWFEYGITRVIGVGKVPTLTIQAMHFVKEANPHQGALAACLMILPVLLVLVANQHLLIKREQPA